MATEATFDEIIKRHTFDPNQQTLFGLFDQAEVAA